MTPDDRAEVRALYNQACHGDGVEPRREARDRLERIAEEAGLDLWRVFKAMGLDMAAWWASRPMERRE